MIYTIDNTNGKDISILNRYLFKLYSEQNTVKECYVHRLGFDKYTNEYGIKNIKSQDDSLGFIDGDYTLEFHNETVKIKKSFIKYYEGRNGCELCFKLAIDVSSEKWDLLNKESIEYSDYHLHKKEGLSVKMYDNGYWQRLKDIPKRKLETIYIPQKDKKKIVKELDDLLDKEMWQIRKKLCIPHKKIFLLHGPPGSGKTSLAKAIATHLGWGIVQIPINPKITSTDLVLSINRLPEKYIILFEDIDSLFNSRNIEGRHLISFSDILNILDGINSPENFVVVLTTNYVEKLDKALIRPGRVDLIIKIGYIKKKEAKEMFLCFFPDNKEFNKFWKFFKNNDKLTGSALHSYLSYCFKNKSFLKNLDILHKETELSLSMYT